jgi:outer membrane protein assembly factor BamE (lipoprotein component of BamABCDE complex)
MSGDRNTSGPKAREAAAPSSRPDREKTIWRLSLAALMLSLIAALAGCSATTIKHGHHLNDQDLQQVQPGMSEDSVRMALGTPDTTSALPGGNAFYYISSVKKESAFFKPEEVDRKVVAVYFNQVGSVTQVANYGMKDGRVFDYAKGETPAYLRDKGFIARFFRGVGPKQKIVDD